VVVRREAKERYKERGKAENTEETNDVRTSMSVRECEWGGREGRGDQERE